MSQYPSHCENCKETEKLVESQEILLRRVKELRVENEKLKQELNDTVEWGNIWFSDREKLLVQKDCLKALLCKLADKVEQYAEAGCIEAYHSLVDENDLSSVVDSVRAHIEAKKNE